MKKRIIACIAMILVLCMTALTLGSCVEGEEPADRVVPSTIPPAAVPAQASHCIDVRYLSQVDSYPCGCESVSAVMALNYAGCEIDVDTFILEYLPQSYEPYYDDDGLLYADSPYEVFIGSPYSDYSYGCYAPVIQKAVGNCLNSDGTNADLSSGSLRVADLTGTSLGELCKAYISRGVPVIVWGTIGMRPISGYTTWILPDGSEFTWRSQEHCLLLVGYDEDYYYFNDPMEGKNTKYAKADAEQAYAALDSQALAIVANS